MHQTARKIGQDATPSRFGNSKTALSQYRTKSFVTPNGQSPIRVLADKNDVYNQLTNSQHMNTI